MGATVASYAIELDAKTDAAGKGIDDLGAKVKNTGGLFHNALASIGDFATSVGPIALVTGGVLGLTSVLRDSVSQAMESQQSQAQLAAVIKSTGGVAGVTAKAANDLADSLQKVTTYDDDAVRGAENILLTYTGIGKNIFPQVTKTALDMATALHLNANDAAQTLGKSLNSLDYTRLIRDGVTFTAQQKAQLDQMKKTGDIAGGQKIILAELSREFGGSAEAAGNTFAGKLAILQNQFKDTEKEIGNALIPILSSLLSALLPLISIVSGALMGAFTVLDNLILERLVVGIQAFSDLIENVVTPTLTRWGTQITNVLTPVLKGFYDYLWNKILFAFQRIQQFVVTYILPAFDQLSQSILVKVLPRFDNLTSMVGTHALGAFQDMTTYVNGTVGPSLQTLGSNVLSSAIEPYLSLTGTLIDDIANGLTPFVDYVLNNTLPALADMGTWIDTNVLPPLASMKTALLDSIDNALTPWVAKLSGPTHDAMVEFQADMLLYMLGPLALLAVEIDGSSDPALDRLRDHINSVKSALKDLDAYVNGTLIPDLNAASLTAQTDFQDFSTGVTKWMTNTALPDLKTVGEYVAGPFVLAFQTFATIAGQAVASFVQGFDGDANQIQDANGKSAGSFNIFQRAVQTLQDLVKPIADTIQQQWQQVQKSLSDDFKKIGVSVGDLSGVWYGLGLAVRIAAIYISATLQGIVTGVGQFVQGVAGYVTGLVEIISGAFSLIGTIVGGAMAVIGDIIHGDWAQIGTDIGNTLGGIGESIGKIMGGIGDALGGIWQATVGTVFGIISGFVSGIMGAFNGLLKDLTGGRVGTFPQLVQNIVDFFANLPGTVLGKIGDFKDQVVKAFQDAVTGIENTFSGIGSSIGNIFTSLWNDVKPGINDVIDGVNHFIDAIDGIQIHIPSVGVGPLQTPAFNWNGMGLGHIPHLASGGDVSGLFVGAEDGPELLMKPGMYNAPPGSHVANAGDTASLLGGGGHSHDIYLDGYKVGKALAPHSVNVTRLATGIRS